MKGFVDFIREQGVVGLAIGFVLGGAVSQLVTALVKDVLQPIIGLLFGSQDGLASLALGPVMYGHFLSVMIDFVIIAAVVYFVFKKIGLEKMDKKKE